MIANLHNEIINVNIIITYLLYGSPSKLIYIQNGKGKEICNSIFPTSQLSFCLNINRGTEEEDDMEMDKNIKKNKHPFI